MTTPRNEVTFTDVVNPCLGKKGDGHDLVCILIHVDDVMFTGRQTAVESFVMKLKEKFEVDMTMVKEYGQEFSFLKRKYAYVEDGLLIKPGQYASNIIKTYEDHFGPARKQKLPATSDIQDADGSNLASPEDAAIYRSIVGMGIYLAQERMDVAFVVKELAGRMSSPTEISLLKAQKLVGYLKETEHQHILLPLPQRGQGINMRSHELWVLESYTDADWSGNRATRKSTSSSVHALNGMIIYSTSRGQKVVSLSSAESELHALVAGACDGICLKHVIEFLTGDQVQHVCWVDNSATRQIACKRGAGRLRHISGKLLWCQDKVASGSLEVKQIGTAYNLADIGTKPLSKVRLRLLLFWCHARDGDGERVGDTVTIQLESGEMVTVPVEYVEPSATGPDVGSSRDAPMAPEPEPVPAAEEEESDESMENSSCRDEPPMIHTGDWEPERVEIPPAQFRMHNRAMTRADLVAREELLKIEALWYHAVRVRDSQLEREMYRAMEDTFPYMDPVNPLN